MVNPAAQRCGYYLYSWVDSTKTRMIFVFSKKHVQHISCNAKHRSKSTIQSFGSNGDIIVSGSGMEATTELLKELNIKKVRRGSELLDEDFDDDDTDTDSDVSEEETTAIVTCVADAVDLDGHDDDDDDDDDVSIESHAMPCHAMPCHAMPCHVMPCHAMPHYIISYPSH